jgi:hypothetical protein
MGSSRDTGTYLVIHARTPHSQGFSTYPVLAHGNGGSGPRASLGGVQAISAALLATADRSDELPACRDLLEAAPSRDEARERGRDALIELRVAAASW